MQRGGRRTRGITLRVSRGALSASGIIGFYRSLWHGPRLRSCPLYLRPIWQRAFNSARPCISRILDCAATFPGTYCLSSGWHRCDFPSILGYGIENAGSTSRPLRSTELGRRPTEFLARVKYNDKSKKLIETKIGNKSKETMQ